MRDDVIPFLSPATAAKSEILEALHRDGFALIEDAYPYMPDGRLPRSHYDRGAVRSRKRMQPAEHAPG